MSDYVVIESTPGYMPDSDDPAIFDNYADAVAYANELADELEEQGYTTCRIASSNNYYAISASTDAKIYDLGRVVSVELDES